MASPYPHSGSLNRKIIIQTSFYTSKQDSGERNEQWTTYATVYASIGESSGGEALETNQVAATNNTTFTIRYKAGIKTKMRIQYNDELYNIKGIEEIGRRRYLIIKTEKR